jgi:glycosyltransferase involved in cell wall biosynthesis
MATVDVSVVITTYNHGRFISDAIESVLTQTYPSVEIVIVDDGSQDDTKEKVKQYGSARYIWQANSGLSAARNTGIRESRGKYIVFLDADDILYPEAVRHNVEFFEKHPDCGFVCGSYRIVSADRTVLFEKARNEEELSYLDFLSANKIAMNATILYRRDVLIAVGGFDESIRACEDWDIYLRIAKHHRIACHGKIVAEYRRHSDNMSHNAGRMFESGVIVLRRQLASVQKGEGHRVAYEAGMELLRQMYLRNMLRQALNDFKRTGRRKAALSQITLGFRFGRGFIVKALARRLVRMLTPGA